MYPKTSTGLVKTCSPILDTQAIGRFGRRCQERNVTRFHQWRFHKQYPPGFKDIQRKIPESPGEQLQALNLIQSINIFLDVLEPDSWTVWRPSARSLKVQVKEKEELPRWAAGSLAYLDRSPIFPDDLMTYQKYLIYAVQTFPNCRCMGFSIFSSLTISIYGFD